MITQPEHVLKADADSEGHAWDGASATTGLPNKESAMDWAEHQRIVCEARHLLQGEPPGSRDVKKIFKQLQSAFVDLDGRTVVRVSKGIHQPRVDPHLQLRTITTFKKGGEPDMISLHKFHLNVSATEIPATTALAVDRFQWKAVQFTFMHTDGLIYKWPALVSPIERKGILNRRLSMSSVQLTAHISAQVKLQQEAEHALVVDAFDKAMADFHLKYGGRKGVVCHSNPKFGDFPNENFIKGKNAMVTISTQSKPAMVHYDKAKKEVVIG